MFDPQIFCHQRFGGISRYVCNLAREMQRMHGVTALIEAPFHFNEYIDDLPRELVHGRRIRALEGLTALAYGMSVLPGKLAARRFKPDVLHNTYYFPVAPPRGACGIVTVHDMIHEKYPHYFAASPLITRIKAASVRAADHVICISDSTKRDVLATYAIGEERISVTHLGYDPLRQLLDDDSESDFKIRVLGCTSPYLLYVGSRANYKNFRGLLAAYANAGSIRREFMMLCFGGGPFSAAERVAIARAGVADRVRQIGGSDAILAATYKHAALYVCPSFYEGFGIPVLEAMSLDCPVACSDTSSLPEVAGDAARLFDPRDPNSIEDALRSVLESSQLAQSLRERGRARSAVFSWGRCAEETALIYRRVIGH